MIYSRFIFSLLTVCVLFWHTVGLAVDLTPENLGFATVTVAGQESLRAHCLVIFSDKTTTATATDSFCVYQQGDKKFRENDNGAIVVANGPNDKARLLQYNVTDAQDKNALKNWLNKKDFYIKIDTLTDIAYLADGKAPTVLKEYTLQLTSLHITDDLNFFAFLTHNAIRGLQNSNTDERLKSLGKRNTLLKDLSISQIRTLLQAGVKIKKDGTFSVDGENTEQLIAALQVFQDESLKNFVTKHSDQLRQLTEPSTQEKINKIQQLGINNDNKWELLTSGTLAENLKLVDKYSEAFGKLVEVKNDIKL